MADPQITTILPTYRRPALLRRAIASVLGQTWPHIRVAVFDNASGDETPRVVEEFARRDPRVHYHCQKSNVGAVGNFQAGMDSVRTPYFSFLSDDDVLLPGFYEHALSCLHREPRARFFCGQTVLYDPVKGSHRLWPTEESWTNGLFEAGEATTRMVQELFTWTGSVFSAQMRARAGPFEPIDVYDVLFMAKAAAQFHFVVSLVPCAIFTVWEGNAYRRMTADQIARSFQVTVERLAAVPGISEVEARLIASHLDEVLRGSMKGRLKSSHLAGDWRSVQKDFGFLARRSDLSLGAKVRVLRKAVRGYLRSRLSPRARSHAGGPTMEEVVRIYSSGQGS